MIERLAIIAPGLLGGSVARAARALKCTQSPYAVELDDGASVQARSIIQLPCCAIAAMQPRRERDVTSQAFVHLPELLFLRCLTRPAEDGDQVEVAASRLVVTSGQ